MPEEQVPPPEPTAEPAPAAPPVSPRLRPSKAAEDAYPTPLLKAEEELLKARWKSLPPDEQAREPGGEVGFALSGGGIRSATFCLGFFQGLAAKSGLIRKIDYLSTVSGGGYFGAFLGRLFTRDYIRTPEDVEAILTTDEVDDPAPESFRGKASGTEPPKVRGVLRNLRENGRYLSPNGSGDLLQGGAVLFRNWVSLQVVLGTFLLMVFLLVQVGRVAVEVPFNDLLIHPAWVDWGLWWSPFVILPVLAFILGAFPLGWAYWLVERVGQRLARSEGERPSGGRTEGLLPFVPLGLVGLLNLFLLLAAVDRAGGIRGEWIEKPSFWIPAALLVVVALTPVWWVWARAVTSRREEEQSPSSAQGVDAPQEEPPGTRRELFRDAAIRNVLSRWLKRGLVAVGWLAALALVDTLGQTLYLVGRHPEVTVAGWIGGTFGGLTALSAFARRLAVKLASDPEGGRVKLPVDVVATIAGLLVALFLLVTLNAASHAVAWAGDLSEGQVHPTVPEEVLRELFEEEADGVVSAEARLPRDRPLDLQVTVPAREAEASPAGLYFETRDSWLWLLPSAGGFLFALLLSWAFGRIWPFLNRSSHQTLYSSRLTRAYLGASNRKRLPPLGMSVTESIPEDDVDLATYWPPPAHNGAPIHLINVTVNETIDGQSQVEQKDRKGMGLALGPCGLSLGVRHHIVAPFGVELDPDQVQVFPDRERTFRVFAYPKNDFQGELLPLGAWVGISGAAFSTGLGTRTSLGLSILMGLANVRLGYWWDSGVDPRWRRISAQRGPDLRQGDGRRPWPLLDRRRPRVPWSRTSFAVQSYLGYELLARFPGTARRHWYLSDGGHFENMGGYELIRRRLPLIVVIDAEADPDYTYGGLANLVRKARLDFKAEIVFMKPVEIDGELPPEVACHVGSLEQLRRGRWMRREESCEEKDGKNRRPKRPVADFEGPERTGRCLVHAALARVIYDDGTQSRLLYVKPSLLGDEPEDVLDYHRQHHDFPQETTADQFFDEAQWESYRRLGQHIAEKIFRTETDGLADLSWARTRRRNGRKREPKDEYEERIARLWHPGRLECPPAAVRRPGRPAQA